MKNTRTCQYGKKQHDEPGNEADKGYSLNISRNLNGNFDK